MLIIIKINNLQNSNKKRLDNKYINNTYSIKEEKSLLEDEKEKEINSNLKEIMMKIHKVKNLQQNNEENATFLNYIFVYNNLFEIYEAIVIKNKINKDPKVVDKIQETDQCPKPKEDNNSKAKESLFYQKNYYNTNSYESNLAYLKNKDSEMLKILNQSSQIGFQEEKQQNQNENDYSKSIYYNLKPKTSSKTWKI